MNALHKLLGGTMLAVVLAAGLAAPALAQKLDKKNPPPATASSTSAIDFGDDSGQWSNDGECDDPRFSGTGSAAELVDADRLKDASDCQAAYDAGTVTFNDGGATATAAIDFGDDSSEWAKDGECDDPRFSGTGAASQLLDADILKDATDCEAAYAAGTVTFKGDGSAATTTPAIDFGDDSGQWTNDGECDDPRFNGAGSAAELVDADILKDATDCKAAYDAGTVSFTGGTATTAAIDYGDDSSEWSKDGECDDPRFSGTGVAGELLDADLGHDATDCRAAVEAGTASYNGGTTTPPVVAFDYGSDFSKWANDGECDDPRFVGEGTNKKLLSEDTYGDATDCQTLEADGRVMIRKVYSPAYIAGAPYDSSHVKFGDNSSDYADDGICDDPRFEGPEAASVLLDSDKLHDSADCKAAYEAGTIILITEAAQGM